MKSLDKEMTDRMARRLLRRVIHPDGALDSTENRTRIGMLEGWVSTVVSGLLCAVKGWLGLVSGSVAMLADAMNNLTDMASSLVIALGFQWSRKPCDEEHPFGHGRIEAVATLVLAFALLAVGFEAARTGIVRLVRPHPIEAPTWLLVVLGATVLIKLALALFARWLARLSKSHVLEADAWNHTFDVLSTLLVVVALFCSRAGWAAVDGWAALLVAFFILMTGYKYGREAIDILLGKKPAPEEMDAVHRIVVAVPGVCGVHEVVVHQYGDVKMVSLHVEIDANMSVMKAHWIAETVEEAVEKNLQWRAVVHVDPVDRSHPLFEELHAALKEFIRTDETVVDFHDLRAEGAAAPFHISVDLIVNMGTKRSDIDAVFEHVRQMLHQQFGDRISATDIGVETTFDSSPMERRTSDLN